MEGTLVDVQGMFFNNQLTLYIGEGDFSFSSSHATRFGVANNVVATSLDSRDLLIKNYGMDAVKNIKNLTDRGALVIHSVNACNMAEKDGSLALFACGRSRFDVVTYNFPHAGFFGREDDPKVIRKHTELMQKFFQNAALLLAPGGVVYVAHKCGPPYDDWNLEENANMHGLQFGGSVPFRKSNFPGYKNRRGSGKRAGQTFELGKAAISMFALRCRVWIDIIKEHPLQTQNTEPFLVHTLSNLWSFTEGRRASSKTPLLQAIAAEVARLEKMKLGPKKQRQLNCLKLVVKVVPLLAKTLAIRQIQSFQSDKKVARLYMNLEQSWSKIQSLALEAMSGNDAMIQTLGVVSLPREEDKLDGDDSDFERPAVRLRTNDGIAIGRRMEVMRREPETAPPVEAEKAKLAASVQELLARSRDTTIYPFSDPRPWAMTAQLSSLPHWVYRQYHDLARRAADMHVQLLKGMDMLICNCCGEVIARQSDVFEMSTEGAIGAYVNAHGYVDETLTLSWAQNLRIIGTPQTENSSFPGYAWILAKCQGCYMNHREQHMGWRFIALHPETRPQTFWGIRRPQLIGSSASQPPYWD